MKKFILVCLGIFISLIIAESILQVTSIFLQKKINNNIKRQIVQKEHITILCIGESTTYNQYPVQLQKILNKDYPNKFTVIDGGLYGQKSINILNNLQTWIDKFKPNIIVSMLGINDWKVLPWEKQEYSMFYNILNKFILYKIFYYFIDCIKTARATNSINEQLDFDKYSKEYTDILEETTYFSELSASKKYINFDKTTKDIYNKNNKYENYYIFSNMKDIDYGNLYKILTYNNIDNDGTYYNPEIFSYVNKKIIEQIPQEQYTDILYGGKAIEFIKNKDIDNAEKFFNKAEQYRLKHFSFNTFKTYNAIVDISIKNNIKFIAMQYPMRSINSLKKILYSNKNYKNIIFISNEENFKKYLYNIGSYDDLFVDQFAGDFGHCTELGNKMIAENVKNYIINYYKENINEQR